MDTRTNRSLFGLAVVVLLLAVAGCGPLNGGGGDAPAAPAARQVDIHIEGLINGAPYPIPVPVAYIVTVAAGTAPVSGINPENGQPLPGVHPVLDEATPTVYHAIIEGAGPVTVQLTAKVDLGLQMPPGFTLRCRAVDHATGAQIDQDSRQSPVTDPALWWVTCFATV